MNTKLKASLLFTAIFLAGSLSCWALPSNLSYGFAMDKQNFLYEWEELNTSTENTKWVTSKQLIIGRNYFGNNIKNISIGTNLKLFLDKIIDGPYYGLSFRGNFILAPDSNDFSSALHDGGVLISAVPELGYNLLLFNALIVGISTELGIGVGYFKGESMGFFNDVKFELRTDALVRFKVGFTGLPFAFPSL